MPPEAGAFRIQLGSLNSASAAEAEWRRRKRRQRDLLEALRPRVQRADLGAKGVFYRLQAGPLADAGRSVDPRWMSAYSQKQTQGVCLMRPYRGSGVIRKTRLTANNQTGFVKHSEEAPIG